MKYKVLFLTYILFCQPSPVFATPAKKAVEKTKAVETAKEVAPTKEMEFQSIEGNKKEWSLNIQRTLPGLLCDSQKYFVNCFNVSQHECTEYTQLLVKACLSNIQLALPQTLDKAQGEYWGQMVGKCSYDLYEKFMQPKKLPKPGCQELNSQKDDLPKPSQATP